MKLSPAISPYDGGEIDDDDDDDGGSHHDRGDDGFFSSPQAVEHSLQATGKINCTTSAGQENFIKEYIYIYRYVVVVLWMMILMLCKEI